MADSVETPQLSGRRIKVVVDVGAVLRGLSGEDFSTALVISDLRAKFKIKKTISKEPNTAEIQVYNLSQHTRADMHSRGSKVILEAGYKESIERIFSGDARFITHVNEGPDWITKIDCGDSERVYSFAKISESFRPGTKVKDVAGKILDALGIDAAQAKKSLADLGTDFVNGRVVHGNAVHELEKIVRAHGYEFSIQDGAAQLTKLDTPIGTQSILLTPNSGLVGSPEYGTSDATPIGEVRTPSLKANGKAVQDKRVILKAKSLLQPGLRCGGLVRIESFAVKGNFRIESVTHTGDTAGGEWYSELECTPIS